MKREARASNLNPWGLAACCSTASEERHYIPTHPDWVVNIHPGSSDFGDSRSLHPPLCRGILGRVDSDRRGMERHVQSAVLD